MDHLECERDEAGRKRDQAVEKLKEWDAELSEVQEWLEISRKEVGKLEARNASRRHDGTGQQILTGLQTRPSPDPLADHEDKILDQSVTP